MQITMEKSIYIAHYKLDGFTEINTEGSSGTGSHILRKDNEIIKINTDPGYDFFVRFCLKNKKKYKISQIYSLILSIQYEFTILEKSLGKVNPIQ
jgi:hypothetical protein